MNTTSHLWRKGSLLVLIVVFLAVLTWLVRSYGDLLGADSLTKKVILGILTVILIVLIRISPVFSRYVKAKEFRLKGENEGAFPANETRIEKTVTGEMLVNEIRDVLKVNYGRRWRAKTRILLVMGAVTQVDQLVPKLTSQRWVEGDGVVLIWGGGLTEAPDATLFDAIRKLHRRPLDGIVWV
ncbi:MAG: hypothetical protein RSA84_25005, partial [Acinetobacter sp.]